MEEMHELLIKLGVGVFGRTGRVALNMNKKGCLSVCIMCTKIEIVSKIAGANLSKPCGLCTVLSYLVSTSTEYVEQPQRVAQGSGSR